MILVRQEILLISLAMGLLIFSSINYSYAQTIQDLSCSACITISDTKSLESHKSLSLPIILWAENFDYVYDHKSVFTINGIAKLNSPETPITVTVTDPIGNLVTVEQIMASPNSNFMIKFNPGGPLWKKDGMYIIKAQAGPQSSVFKTNVEIISTGIGSKTECKVKEITVMADNGGRYCIPYTTTGKTDSNIKSIDIASLNTKSKLLKFEIRSLDIQSIILEIDKKLLDSKTPTGENNPFNVLLNGKTVKFEELESKLPNYRTLSIPIPRDVSTIEITGTHVIPEFGSIAVLILVVAIISIVVLSNKKISLINNFSKL
jgi:predicted secreted protein with PEFG-CTERM motif